MTEFVGSVCNEDHTTYIPTVLDGEVSINIHDMESLFSNPTWWKMLQSSVYQNNLVVVVVDKAHCVLSY